MTLSTSRRQLHYREVMWGGSPRQSCELTDRNHIVRRNGLGKLASDSKTRVIKGPWCVCGNYAAKVSFLIPGDLHKCYLGCSSTTINKFGDVRWVVSNNKTRKSFIRYGEVSRGHSTNRDILYWLGRTERSIIRQSNFLLTNIVMIAATPSFWLGLPFSAWGEARKCYLRERSDILAQRLAGV